MEEEGTLMTERVLIDEYKGYAIFIEYDLSNLLIYAVHGIDRTPVRYRILIFVDRKEKEIVKDRLIVYLRHGEDVNGLRERIKNNFRNESLDLYNSCKRTCERSIDGCIWRKRRRDTA